MLQKVSPVLQEDMCKEARDPKNAKKNRYSSIVPGNSNIVRKIIAYVFKQ